MVTEIAWVILWKFWRHRNGLKEKKVTLNFLNFLTRHFSGQKIKGIQGESKTTMSELGLGFQEKRKKKKKKKHDLHSKITDFENSSFSSKGIGEVLVKEDEVAEEEKEEAPHSENCLVPHFPRGEDLEQEEWKDEKDKEETLGPKERFWNPTIHSETHPITINKQHLPRTASLDLNCQSAAILSPEFRGVSGLKKSPWTPNYQKGWSSERVPLPINGKQKYLCNGKPLPSKWEDAERWIGSPVSIDGHGRVVVPSYYRRPKSKSGPLGDHSPLAQCFDNGRVVNMAASSPFLAGVLVADRQCHGGVSGERFIAANVESYLVQQSEALHEWSDLSSPCTIQDEKFDSKESSVVISPRLCQKDRATQMSSSSSLSAEPIVDMETQFSKSEIRDVQVDDQEKKIVTSDRSLRNIIDWKNKTEEDKSSAWEVTETSRFLSKYNREEVKIRSWKNLQEAKAEAAIRKLEMKLEKERSSSMDKILDKLRSAQRKAEDMRNAVRANQAQQTGRTSKKASFFVRTVRMSFLGGCFTCYAS